MDWSAPAMAASVQAIGDAWIAAASSLVLQVPSATIRGESNYLFNPAHADVGTAVCGAISPLTFDPRLLK